MRRTDRTGIDLTPGAGNVGASGALAFAGVEEGWMALKYKLESERLRENLDAIDRVMKRRSAEKGSKRHLEAVRRHIRELESKRDLLIEWHQEASAREERASRPHGSTPAIRSTPSRTTSISRPVRTIWSIALRTSLSSAADTAPQQTLSPSSSPTHATAETPSYSDRNISVTNAEIEV
jgi:hypothetical protein